MGHWFIPYILRTQSKRITGTVLILFFLLASPLSANDEVLNIHFLDVGEGEATLIETPNGQTVLIDTGNLITGYRIVEYLQSMNIATLDHLIVTHMHPDHVGGIFFLAQLCSVTQFYDNGEDLSSRTSYPDLYRWYSELIRTKPNWRTLHRGNLLTVDAVRINVLWPPDPLPYTSSNPNSLVLLVQYYDFTLLHMADAPIPVEQELLEREKTLDADVLKVGHHGHIDASSPAFIDAVSPTASIISINKDNVRGYPAKEVVERLEARGSRVYRTYQHGTIVLTVARDGTFKVKTEKTPPPPVKVPSVLSL